MSATDAFGYFAGSLVLATFFMTDMASLRLTAIASNIAFIVYGYVAGIEPVLLLHALLLPMNAIRILQWYQARPRRS